MTDDITIDDTEDHEENDDGRIAFHANESQAGQRIDKALAEYAPDLSRARVQNLIKSGHVMVNGAPCPNASLKLKEGDAVETVLPPPVPWHPEAQDIPLNIVYEDSELLVIDKQAGLVVHPGAGNREGTLVNALLQHCGGSLSGIGGILRPGILHRLDKDTTGLLLVAKTDAAHRDLAEQLKERTMSRRYLAAVLGVPVPPKGYVDRNIGRHPGNRLKMTVGGRDARTAKTYYHVLGRNGDSCALIECALETGRTHQIRVHMAAIGHPVLGDPLYGAQANAIRSAMKKAGLDESTITDITAFPRQALHAFALSFDHPLTGERMDLEAEIPADMQDLLQKTGLGTN